LRLKGLLQKIREPVSRLLQAQLDERPKVFLVIA
jgi:hypothetical protein